MERGCSTLSTAILSIGFLLSHDRWLLEAPASLSEQMHLFALWGKQNISYKLMRLTQLLASHSSNEL